MIFEVEPTMRCNLTCPMCSHGANHKSVKQDEMTREDWLHNLEHFLPEDELVITGGEPTLFKSLEFMIDSWVERFNKPVMRITSNAHKWQRFQPLMDKIDMIHFSHYPGVNDKKILEVRSSDISKLQILDMPKKDFWDVYHIPDPAAVTEEMIQQVPKHCGLMTNKAVSKRHVWSCCVGGFFYRRIKELPTYYGGVEIGSPNWRTRVETNESCSSTCQYCFVLPLMDFTPGQYIQEKDIDLTAIKALTQDPDQVFNRAYQAHKDKKMDLAARGYQRVLKLNPKHPDALHLMGLLEFDKGNTGQAISLMKRSLEQAPNEIQWHLNLGRLLSQVNDLEAAKKVYQNAIDLDPACQEATQALEHLAAAA